MAENRLAVRDAARKVPASEHAGLGAREHGDVGQGTSVHGVKRPVTRNELRRAIMPSGL